MLENALAAGVTSAGADVVLLGVVPTPAVAYLVRELDADAGIMISASHNPFEYNGIKIFNGQGFKLADAIEEEIEAVILGETPAGPPVSGAALGRCTVAEDAREKYVEFLASTVPEGLAGVRVAVDCANGSASTTARALFQRLGADAVIVSDEPNGININDGCGSTHLENLKRTVLEQHCDIGVAFDGDADRCLAVDRAGREIDGDRMIAVFARRLKRQGRLRGDTAVVTTMTNMGFYAFAKENGIAVRVTGVGDRYVLEEMQREGYSIGGEQSGHIIFLDYTTTGDGQLSAIQLLAAFLEEEKQADFAGVMESYPQILLNLHATSEQKALYREDESIAVAVAAADKALGDAGRVVVRPSGTEPLIRVMVEGRDEAEIRRVGEEICAMIREKTGAQ